MKILIVSDIHAPYQNEDAINKTLLEILKEKPDLLINLGDTVDWDVVSRFSDTAPCKGSLVEQAEIASDILSTMYTTSKKANKKCKSVFVEGNHCSRLNDYILRNRELTGLTSTKKLLRLSEIGYQHVPYGEIYMTKGFAFIHGFYYGVNPAKKHLDMMKTSVIFGHNHSPISYFGSSHEKKKPAAYGLGCLCRTDMDYLKGRPTSWVNSIGLLEITNTGHQFRHIIL